MAVGYQVISSLVTDLNTDIPLQLGVLCIYCFANLIPYGGLRLGCNG